MSNKISSRNNPSPSQDFHEKASGGCTTPPTVRPECIATASVSRGSQILKTLLSLLPPALLVLITSAIYYPSLRYDFIFDDIANINQYFNIRHTSPREIFMSSSRWVSRLLNLLHYKIGQFDPFSYRVGNLVIHIANGLLIYGILKLVLNRVSHPNATLHTSSGTSSQVPRAKSRSSSDRFSNRTAMGSGMGSGIGSGHNTAGPQATHTQGLARNFFAAHAAAISWLTALFFLIHPVQTQTVSYVIQGQLEGTAMLAALSMVFCLLKLAETETKMSLPDIAQSPRDKLWRTKAMAGGALYTGTLLALAVIACGTKEIAIVIPALLLLANWFFISPNLKPKNLKKWLALHTVITGIMGGLYIYL